MPYKISIAPSVCLNLTQCSINREASGRLSKRTTRPFVQDMQANICLKRLTEPGLWRVISLIHWWTASRIFTHISKKGSHKIAANKLRIKHNTDCSSNSFRNGLLLGAGGVPGLRRLVYAANHFYNYPDPVIALHTSYLLQIYAGFFLALVLVLGLCLGCWFWTNNRINYVFIFEFDPRSSLDWRQMAEISCLLWFLLGLIMWLNFGPFVRTRYLECTLRILSSNLGGTVCLHYILSL